MKTSPIIVAVVLLILVGCKSDSEGPTKSGLFLSERSHAFGGISDTQTVSHIFHLRNDGSDSLKILDVHSSCGCTPTMVDKKILGPGDSANLKVTFNPQGKSKGKVDKTVWITTNAGKDSVTISAEITMLHKGEMMTVTNIFEGDCRKCHVDKGVGKFGRELYNASCLMCHSPSPNSHAPHLGRMKAEQAADTTYYRFIAHGKHGTNMPAYAQSRGGPLTEKQIQSLVTLLTELPKPPAH